MPNATDTNQTLTAIDQYGCGLQITFDWQRDRFTRSISAVDAKRDVVLLASLEGTNDDEWPLSPPLQSLAIEQREEGRQVALLVGMAGRSHWSMSVESWPNEQTLVFDAACRIHESPTMLGATYQTMFAPSRLGSQSFDIGHECKFESAAMSDSAQSMVHESEGRISLRIDTNKASLPKTFRWQYTISRR